MDLDELQDKFGGMSSYQLALIAIVSVLPLATSIMSQTSVIYSAVPSHRCFISEVDDNEIYSTVQRINLTAMIIPVGNKCERYAFNLTSCISNGSFLCGMETVNDTISCDNGYVYNDIYNRQTTVSEWDLVCEHITLDSAANSIYFFGVFIGSALVGPMMDWWGRKLSMLIFCIGTILSGIGVALSPNYAIYILMRALSSMSSIPCFIAFHSYVNEISSVKWRAAIAAFGNMISALGHTLVPLVAYFFRNWRAFGVCVSLFSSPFLVIYFFIPRSPRWLLAKLRHEEAKEIVLRYARSRKVELLDADWNTVVKTEANKIEVSSTRKKYVISDLYRLPLMRVLSINVVYLWFVSCMVFYGLVLNVGKLAGDPYINATMNAIAEILSYAWFYLSVRTIGMRKTCSSSYILAGACCLVSMLLAQSGAAEGSRWVAIVGKVFASLAFATIYQYTAELYPTVARGTGMSMGSMSARVGSIIMPFTLQLQHTIPWLTQTVFGVLIIVGGFTSLLLPETYEAELLTGMDEAESFYRKEMKFTRRLLGIGHCEYERRSSIKEELEESNTMI